LIFKIIKQHIKYIAFIIV